MQLNSKLKLYLGTSEFYKRVGIIAVPIALQLSLIHIWIREIEEVPYYRFQQIISGLGPQAFMDFGPKRDNAVSYTHLKPPP